MDFRDILKSFDNLSEATTTTDKGTVHKAGAGGYGNQYGSDEVSDQYGKPKGKVSLSKLGSANEPKRGKGRPPNPDKAKSYDSSALSKAMGMGKAPAKPSGKPSVKHSLKEYFDQMDEALSEAGLAVQPMPATPAVKAQQQMATKPSFLIKDPANPSMPAITTQDPAVVQAAKNGTMSMQKPGAATTAPGATPAPGAGSQVKPMEEGGDVGKHNNATTGFDALVRKLTPKYGKEAATKIAGAQLKKIKEAEAPQYFAQSSPLSTANRGVLEGKKGVNPFVKKDDNAEKIGKKVTKDIEKDEKKGNAPKKGVNPFAKKSAKPDFLDIDKDGNKKEPMKKAVKDKKKVKEGMEHNLQAARLQGKSHALRKMPYNCTNDDMEEARHYHDGFKEGLDECYGQMPILGLTAIGEMGQGPEVGTMASYGADDMGEAMYDEGNAFTAGLAKTPQGGKFKVGGSTFTDRTRYDSPLDEFAFESLDKQLNSLLENVNEGRMNELSLDFKELTDAEFKKKYGKTKAEFRANVKSEENVSEGMTVSISKGQQGSPDSVTVSAQDGEADQLLSIIKSAGLGLFGGEEQGFNAPQGSAGAHGGISVVDDHDGMMSLMKKLSGTGGGEMTDGGDYEDEEGSGEEDHMHGHEAETCESCGGMMEENHQCESDDQSVMGEDQSEAEMTDDVAEANAPDSGADNTNADVAGNAAANSALATADAGADEEEGEVYSSPTNEAEDETGEEAGTDALDEDDNCKKCDCNPCKCETMSESSFTNLFRKIAMLSEESTKVEESEERPFICVHAKKGKCEVKASSSYQAAQKAAQKWGLKSTAGIDAHLSDVKKDTSSIEESYANSADDTFEAGIGFMMNVISGGLNKQKSTGQTTIPVISGQKNRMGADGLGNPMKESTELLKDYMKLSGL
jgi:hypothetical protein